MRKPSQRTEAAGLNVQQSMRLAKPVSTVEQRRRCLDLGLLSVVVALADTHSVSSAALALGLSQPQISVALAKLRKLFDDPLFVRTVHGMQPTPRAVAVVRSARGVLDQIDDAFLAGGGFDPATAKRPFVFALSDAGEMIVLPPVLPALRKEAPHVPVHSATLCSPISEIIAGLQSGEIDLAVGYLPELRRSNLYQQALFTDSFAGLIRADHPVTARHLTMQQFTQFEHVVSTRKSSGSEALDRHLARKRIHCRIGFLSSHMTTLPSIVARSDMIMTVPRRLADYLLTVTSGLRCVELPFELPSVEICQYWHPRFQHDPRNRWLRSLVARTFHQDKHEAS